MGKANSKRTGQLNTSAPVNPHSTPQSALPSQIEVLIGGAPAFSVTEDRRSSRQAQFRNFVKHRFQQRISQAGVWHPEGFLNYTSVTLFSWDDTLLCTTFLDSRSDALNLQSSLLRCQMQTLDHLAFELLSSALAVSKTFIVTNALMGWVEYSASMWLPNLCGLLSRVNVISARAAYEEEYPGQPTVWKARAFLQTLDELRTEAFINFLSFGDSELEVNAAKAVAE